MQVYVSVPQVACVRRALRAYFKSNLSVLDAEDPVQFRMQMLLNEDDGSDCIETTDEQVAKSVTVKDILVGVSGASYVAQLALILYSWHLTGTNPLLSSLTAPPETLLEGVTAEFTSRQRALDVSLDVIHAFFAAVENILNEEISIATIELVDTIGGSRGILTLLGFQQTVGSRNVAPLTLRQCLSAFAQCHSLNEQLTVGARAFTKHCARCSSGWWGEFRGNDTAKNVQAEAKVRDLLATATWKNIHSLPHGHATMEIRNLLGYGARWDVETQTFRGFLEPPMLNGHEIKWRH